MHPSTIPRQGLWTGFGGESSTLRHLAGLPSIPVPLCNAHGEANEKVNHKKLIIFEGFRPNGLQIRNQRIFLHRIAPVKIDFDDFGKNIKMEKEKTKLKTLRTHSS